MLPLLKREQIKTLPTCNVCKKAKSTIKKNSKIQLTATKKNVTPRPTSGHQQPIADESVSSELNSPLGGGKGPTLHCREASGGKIQFIVGRRSRSTSITVNQLQAHREAAGPHTHRSTRPSCMEPNSQTTKKKNQRWRFWLLNSWTLKRR